MSDHYSISEILNAVEELQEKKTKKIMNVENKSNKILKDDIPQNTLRLIEEAEKRIKRS